MGLAFSICVIQSLFLCLCGPCNLRSQQLRSSTPHTGFVKSDCHSKTDLSKAALRACKLGTAAPVEQSVVTNGDRLSLAGFPRYKLPPPSFRNRQGTQRMKLQNYCSQLVLAKNVSLLSSTIISLDKKQAVQWQYCVGPP